MLRKRDSFCIFIVEKQIVTNNPHHNKAAKLIEFFCILNELCKYFVYKLKKHQINERVSTLSSVHENG